MKLYIKMNKLSGLENLYYILDDNLVMALTDYGCVYNSLFKYAIRHKL